MQTSIRLTEIFYSIQGESLTMGMPTIFIRLTGCPLRCQYCDTAYAFKGGKRVSLSEIIDQISIYKTSHVCVTGGEPLSQPGCLDLLKVLCDAGYQVSLETSGAFAIEQVDQRVMIVMDLKTPDSLEAKKNRFANIDHLKSTDQIKFVICSRSDFDWAVEQIKHFDLSQKVTVLFSPSWEELPPTELAEWILQAQLPIRLQIQLHKVLWQNEPGR